MLDMVSDTLSEPAADAAVRGERRLQVQAFNEWLRVANGQPFPNMAAMDKVAIPDFRDHSFALRIPPDDPADDGETIPDPEFDFIGAALLADCPDVGPIGRVSDVPPMSLLTRLTGHYFECIANAAPVGFEASFVNRLGTAMVYRGILLPVSDNGKAIDHVWGTINCKAESNADTVPAPPPLAAQPDPEPPPPPKPRASAKKAEARPSVSTPTASKPQNQPDRTTPPPAPTENRSTPAMSIEAKLAECMEIDGAIAVALVDAASGMAIATSGNPRKLDLNVAAAGSSNVLKAKQQTIKELGLEEEIEDVLITLTSQYHLIRPLTDASGKGLAIYLLLDKAKANLAMARFKLTRIEKDLAV